MYMEASPKMVERYITLQILGSIASIFGLLIVILIELDTRARRRRSGKDEGTR